MQEMFVSLYGEVQKEVIQQTLANDFGIDVGFRETTTICVERPIGSRRGRRDNGQAAQSVHRDHRRCASIRLPINSGIEFRLEVEFGSIPLPFHKAVEDTAPADAAPGAVRMAGHRLHGNHDAFRLQQCRKRGRGLPQLDAAVADGRTEAGRHAVCEPMQSLPARDSSRHAGRLCCRCCRGSAPFRRHRRCEARRACSRASIPAARVHQLQQQLPALTRGEGRARKRLRPLPADARHGPDQAALRLQSAQPQGIHAAPDAAPLQRGSVA